MSRATVFAIVGLCVYGDLLKRVLPGSIALATIYVCASLLLIRCQVEVRKKAALRPVGESLYFLVTTRILIIVYIVWTLLSLQIVPGLDAVSASLYVLLPLAFMEFAVARSNGIPTNLFFIVLPCLMMPVHLIGIVQRFVDSSFLISTVYTQSGGIIHRNVFAGGTMDRLPSIYTSADRYSALSLLHALTAIQAIATLRSSRALRMTSVSLVIAITGLLIAGARSRILLFIALVPIILVFARSVPGLTRLTSSGRQVIVVLLCAILIWNFSLEKITERLQVIEFLIDSFQRGDITSRIVQACLTAIPPDDTTTFGLGLGSMAGKPREFALAGLWIENGFVGGLMFISVFVVLISLLFVIGVKAYARGSFQITFGSTASALILLMGILTGLTSALEISSGVLFCLFCGQVVGLSSVVLERSVAARVPIKKVKRAVSSA